MEIGKIDGLLVITIKGSTTGLSRSYNILSPTFNNDVTVFLEFAKKLGYEIDDVVTNMITFIDNTQNFELRISNTPCEDNFTYDRVLRNLISKQDSILNVKLREEYGFELS